MGIQEIEEEESRGPLSYLHSKWEPSQNYVWLFPPMLWVGQTRPRACCQALHSSALCPALVFPSLAVQPASWALVSAAQWAAILLKGASICVLPGMLDYRALYLLPSSWQHCFWSSVTCSGSYKLSSVCTPCFDNLLYQTYLFSCKYSLFRNNW